MELEEITRRDARRLALRYLPRLYVIDSLWDSVVPGSSGIYYKVYRDVEKDRYAILYVIEWDYQYVPPHKFDYEPIVARSQICAEEHTDSPIQ